MFNDYFCKNFINDLFKYDSIFILFIYIIIFFIEFWDVILCWYLEVLDRVIFWVESFDYWFEFSYFLEFVKCLCEYLMELD